jgi:hypothetical protein
MSEPNKDLKKYSDIFEDMSQLKIHVDNVYCDTQDTFDNYEVLYKFDNMRSIHDAEELEESGDEEIINYGSSNRDGQLYVAPIESLATESDRPINIEFDTNDVFADRNLSTFATELYNQLVYQQDNVAQTVWGQIAGYGWQRGYAPTIHDIEEDSIYPRVAVDMRFPPGTPLITHRKINFAERVYEDLHYLNHLKTISKDGHEYVDYENVKELIDIIKKRAQEGTSVDTAGDEYDVESRPDEENNIDYRKHTIRVCKYYEARFENGKPKISVIHYVDSFTVQSTSMPTDPLVIFADDNAYDSWDDFFNFYVFDEEIGGEKTTDNIKGLSEAVFEPNQSKEIIKNRRRELALAASMPFILPNGKMSVDDALKFKFGESTVAPDGADKDSFYFAPDTSRHLDGVVFDLDSSSTAITGGERSNFRRGQETRNQTLDRLGNNEVIKKNRLRKAVRSFRKFNQHIFHRFMTLDVDKDSPSYNVIMYFRECMYQKIQEAYNLENEKEAKAKFKELAEQRYGFAKHYSVKVRNNLGIDPDDEQMMIQVLQQSLQQGIFDAQTSNDVRRLIMLTATHDDDIVNGIFRSPEEVRKNQNTLAAMEWSVIERRTFAGEEYAIDSSDIHVDHLRQHLLDMIADINVHGVQPWTEAMVMTWAAKVRHVSQHIAAARTDPASQSEFKELFPTFQQVVAQSTNIIQELSEIQEQQSQDSQDPQDVLRLEQARLARVKSEEIMQRMALQPDDVASILTQRNLRSFREGQKLDLLKRQQAVKERIDYLKLLADGVNNPKQPTQRTQPTQ